LQAAAVVVARELTVRVVVVLVVIELQLVLQFHLAFL
jgi:hypothetical protein